VSGPSSRAWIGGGGMTAGSGTGPPSGAAGADAGQRAPERDGTGAAVRGAHGPPGPPCIPRRTARDSRAMTAVTHAVETAREAVSGVCVPALLISLALLLL
jgi:hypothetical protein